MGLWSRYRAIKNMSTCKELVDKITKEYNDAKID